jgi:competence protein ComEC
MPIILPYTFLGSFLATVFALQWWIRPAYPTTLWIILGFVGLLGLIPRLGKIPIALSLGIIIALLSASHAADRGHFPLLDGIASITHLTVHGTVTGQPDDRGTRFQYILQTGSGRILVTDRSQGTMPAPGDILDVHGRAIPVDAGTSYERYLRMRNIGAVVEAHGTTIIGQADHQDVNRWLWRVKLGFQSHLRRVFPEPAAGLLDGLLTGSNGGLTENVQADFRTTGLSHIVAVSGSNITVVLSVLSGLLFFLPLRWRFLPCATGIVLFTLFVGASASVVRAAVTGIIGLIALQSERQNDARLATLWTAFAMLCRNPWQLWADAGFQLSFLAVIGLIELSPFIEPLLKRVPQTGGMRDALTATLAAQCTAVPWGIALFGAVPLISPLSNVLVAPLIPLAMLTGAVSLLIAAVMPPLATVAGLPASLLLNGIILAAHLLACIPSASVTVPAPPAWLMGLYYLLLCGIVLMLHRYKKNRRRRHNRDAGE